MAAIFKFKRSSVMGAAPIPSGLVDGEVALNTTDMRLFIKNASNQVVSLNDWDNIYNKPADVIAAPYDIGGSYNGTIPVTTVLLRYPMPRDVVFPVGLAGSYGVAEVAATAQTDFVIRKNGVSFGTMRFAAAATTATFISAGGATFAPGDVLSVVSPGSADATLASIGFSLTGVRQ